MFIKIHNHRCDDDETGRFGTHFFYEYDVRQTGESDTLGETTEYDGEDDTYEETRRLIQRRGGVPLRSVGFAALMPRSLIDVLTDKTLKSSVEDVRNGSSNITTNVDIRQDVLNTTSKVIASGKVVNGTEPQIVSNVTSVHNANKIVSESATRIHNTSRRGDVTSVASAPRSTDGLAQAIRAVSNFGLSLAKFTAHYSNAGNTQLADQRSKAQANKQNRVVNQHFKTTSPNRATSSPLLETVRPRH